MSRAIMKIVKPAIIMGLWNKIKMTARARAMMCFLAKPNDMG